MHISDWMEKHRYNDTVLGKNLADFMGLDKPFHYQTVGHWRKRVHTPRTEVVRGLAKFTKGAVGLDDWN